MPKEIKKPLKERTVQDVLDTFNEEQKQVLYFLLGAAKEDKTPKKTGG